MKFSLEWKKFRISEQEFFMYVPLEAELKKLCEANKISVYYWSRVWPAAIALSEYIVTNPGLVRNKAIVELAAGLGLPSIVASSLASTVRCSDKDPQAVEVMNQTISRNGIKNCFADCINWNELPTNLGADVVLLSDINYNPVSFPDLKNLIYNLLDQHITIALSTPQRLAAKNFIEDLMMFCKHQEEVPVGDVMVSIFILEKKDN